MNRTAIIVRGSHVVTWPLMSDDGDDVGDARDAWIPQMSANIDQSLTYQLYRSFWSASLLANRLPIFRLSTSFLYVAVWFPTVSFDKTAVLQVASGLSQAVDWGELGALNLLDLTAAFDTVDNDILLQRLQQRFGADGIAYRWFLSYLLGSTQSVRRGALRSLVYSLLCGVFWVRCCSFCTPSTSSNWSEDMHGVVYQWHSSQRLMPSFQRQRVFVVDLRLPGRRCQLDAVEQASVKLIEDWSHMVCVDTVSRLGEVSLRPWHLHRRRPEHDNSRTVHRVEVFRRTPYCRRDDRLAGMPPATFQTSPVVDLVMSRLDYGNGLYTGRPTCLPCTLNGLPEDVSTSPTLPIFR